MGLFDEAIAAARDLTYRVFEPKVTEFGSFKDMLSGALRSGFEFQGGNELTHIYVRQTDGALRDLTPGDKLLAISDGLADSRDAKGESFGEERIAAIAAAQAREPVDVLVAALRRAADDFRQAAPPRDDLSLLGVEFIRPKG